VTSRRTILLTLLAAPTLAAQLACGPGNSRPVSAEQQKIIGDSLKKLVVETYDLSKPNAVERLMSLYPATGPVYSTSSGHISKSRTELQSQIETFWKYVGSNMRNPKWEWTDMHIDVLSPDAAVMTASYRVPHLNPMNMPHTIAGAWTAVFVNRDGRWVVVQEHLSDVPPAPAAAADSAGTMDHSGH
jgi:SnoaL-like domain